MMLLPGVNHIDAVISELIKDCKYQTFQELTEHSLECGEILYFKVNNDCVTERFMYHYFFHLGAAVEQSNKEGFPVTMGLMSSAMITGAVWILGFARALTELYPDMRNELLAIQPFYAELFSAESNIDALTEPEAKQFSDCFDPIFELCEDNLDDYTDEQFLSFVFSPLMVVTQIINCSITANNFAQRLDLPNEP